MVITKQWLRSVGNGAGWTEAQCRLVTDEWPVTHGWIRRLVGKEISDEVAATFTPAPKKMNPGLAKQQLTRARRRLGLPGASKREVLAAIRAAHPTAPTGSAWETLAWYATHHAHAPAAPRPRARSGWRPDRESEAFLASYEWRRLRMEVIKERGRRCECCGASPTDGVTVINVDHIKPRRKHPELALVKANLQVLCGTCNQGKGNWDETDWRVAPSTPEVPAPAEAPAVVRLPPGLAHGAAASDWTVGDFVRPVKLRRRRATQGVLARRANALPTLVKRARRDS